MLGVQPLLLGTLLEERRLSVPELTQAATVEMLVLGGVAGALAAVFSHRHLRAYGLLGCLVLAAANAACVVSSGTAFVLWRAVCGLGGGVLLWITTGVITHGRAPGRLSALFLGAQAATQGITAALLPVTTMPAWGANGGLGALAAVSILSVALLAPLPRSLADLPKADTGHGRLSRRARAGLTASFLYMAGIVGLFVFVDALALAEHITPSVARFAVAWNLTAQLAGAALAALLARRYPPTPALLGCCAGFLIALAALASQPGDAVFLGATLLFGFIWMFGLPYFVPLLISVDPTRRGAMLLTGAQLLGGSAGPQITGWMATQSNLRPVLVSSAGLIVACALSVLLAAGGRPGPRAVRLERGNR